MLLDLEVENLGVLKQVRASFVDGFNAITGETGAGKSLVLKALALLGGDRADKTQVRDGANEARISGLFRIDDKKREEIAELIAPIEIEDDEILLTRTFSVDGRGRAFANGRLITQGVLKAVGSRLVDILGQGDARLLMESDHRARLLDAYGTLYEDHALYLAARERALSRRERRDRLVNESMQRRQRVDYLRYVLAEIAAVEPKPGEAAQLTAELEVLEAGEDLSALCSEGVFSLYEADSAMTTQIEKLLRRVHGLKDGAQQLLAPARAALERAAVEITEAARELRSAQDSIASDPQRLEVVNSRLDALRKLIDRFGPTEERLLMTRDESESELRALEADDEDQAAADRALEEAVAELDAAATRLDKKRLAAGAKLARAVEKELHRLGMPYARFIVSLTKNPGDAVSRAQLTGASKVEFLLQANPGLKERPLEEVASGGEAARIALALSATLSDVLDVPCLVFDEIESGIGQRLGDIVADCLADIAKKRQVIVVSHLPAVAAKAQRHLRIVKKTQAGATASMLETLEGRARELEIAAMLRGESHAEKARGTARDMLAKDHPA